jgi:hypothetical protein
VSNITSRGGQEPPAIPAKSSCGHGRRARADPRVRGAGALLVGVAACLVLRRRC